MLAGTPPPLPANDPPKTLPFSFSPFTALNTPFVDIDITARVVDDGTGGTTTGAVTSFSRVPVRYPGYRKDADDKITRFHGKLTWKGIITIQTRYASDAAPKSPSCYGRGTTPDDLRSRNITLGFHESCHRGDFVGYLRTHPLPSPPPMATGTPASEYERALAAFLAQVEAYWTDMERDSELRTDEVGFTKSSAVRTNSCQVHVLP